MARQPVGAAVQLARRSSAPSSQTTATASGVRAACAAISSCERARAGSAPARRVVPLAQELVALGRGEQRQLGERQLRVAGDAGEQRREVAGQPRDRRGVEQVGAVLQRAARARRGLDRARRVRSNLAVAADELERRQASGRGSSSSRSAVFCKASITWKSGGGRQARARARSSSTSCSNGRSWWA